MQQKLRLHLKFNSEKRQNLLDNEQNYDKCNAVLLYFCVMYVQSYFVHGNVIGEKNETLLR